MSPSGNHRRKPEATPPMLFLMFEPEIRAWRGEAPLGRVFWLYGIATSWVLIALWIIPVYRQNPYGKQLLLLVLAPYTWWVLVAVWRCAGHARQPWQLLARSLTVAWAGNAALVLLFLQIDVLLEFARS